MAAVSKDRKPSPVPLPLTKGGVEDVVATLKHEVNQQYAVQREKFMDKTLGSNAESRKKRTPAQVDNDFLKLKKENPVLASSDPFKATWLPGRGDIPAIPPREVFAAAKGPHSLEPKEGLMLHDFMTENDRLLAMTVEEIQSITYLDAWLLKFVLTRYFDFTTAATRFLNLRAVFHKHDLSFTYDENYATVYNGGFSISAMYSSFSTDPEFVLPPMPDLSVGAPTDPAGIKLREKHPYRVHRTPIVLARTRYNDFSKFDFSLFKKAWFFFVASIGASDYYEQTHGHVMIMSGKDSGFSNMSREFGKFAGEAISSAMPVKVQRMFLVNQGFVFNNVLTPLMKVVLSKKMQTKMVTVADESCKEIVSECGQIRVPVEMGGTMPLDDDGLAAKQWLFKMMGRKWISSEEKEEDKEEVAAAGVVTDGGAMTTTAK